MVFLQLCAHPAPGFLSILSFLLLIICLQQQAVADATASQPCFPALFVFGNSLSDTGNGVLTGNVLFTRASQNPYGATFPGHPSGRFSDGRLLVDFLAEYVGLPPVNPSLDSGADFSRGVNYAIAGAAALNASELRSLLVGIVGRDYSLEVQLGWHLSLKASGNGIKKPSRDAYSTGLYVLEFGGNDYINALRLSLYSPLQVSSVFVPLVISKIRDITTRLYTHGARHFLFVSITPLGCSPVFLASGRNGEKDSFGCLKDINSLSYKHGSELVKLAKDLRVTLPDADFVVVDYYDAYEHILENSDSYGFTNTLDACCGAGQDFSNNFNLLLFCNKKTSTKIPSGLCPDPNVYLNWDGIHFTDRFNSLVFDITIGGKAPYLYPPEGFSMCRPGI
ncbi:hypothetical protein GOP47_0002852 [Adiantum capillus-veneris]|uniref:GDSL esterase/lipase n=1 Tax=Adiantum capillus-veneris TaxID=13818 RepID=A0A9D4ZPJ6_ADICA|nr:hypothetical protein GOP47_0002852 [Adiantum capillus-veneris]